ncbi:MAG: hypothetical protein ACYS76_05055 [Planctomycetota bacterium]
MARTVDNYLSYLTGTLREGFCCRPDILRSSEKIEFAEVLSFESIDHLVAHLADKKVHDLSYKSVAALDDYFQDRLLALAESIDRNESARCWLAERDGGEPLRGEEGQG